MQSTNSRFVSNIVPLQNVQTNISGQGVQQTTQTAIASLQATVATLQTTVSGLLATVASLQTRLAVLEGKVG
jgi:hypothetical protein